RLPLPGRRRHAVRADPGVSRVLRLPDGHAAGAAHGCADRLLKMKRPIGLAALTVLELPHEEQIRVAAQTGYTHVGLRLVPVAGQPYTHVFHLPTVEKRLAETGIRVLDVEVFRLTPETKVGDFEAILEASARLKASDLLVHGADPDEARLAA